MWVWGQRIKCSENFNSSPARVVAVNGSENVQFLTADNVIWLSASLKTLGVDPKSLSSKVVVVN